jgi:protein NRD1
MARQNTTAASANPSVPAQDNSYNMLPAHNNTAQRVASLNPTYPFPSSTQSVNVPPPAAPVFAQQPQGTNITAPAFPSNQNGGVAPPAAQGTVNPALQQQLMILKTLADTGVPQEQWGGIIAALTATSSSQAIPAVATNGVNAAPPALQFGGPNAAPNSWGPRPDESRDRSGYNDGSRTPPGRYRRRSRSPSPQRGWNARDSPASRRRDEYGDFGRDSPGHGRNDDVRGRGYDYRQRSPPPRRNRSNSPPRNFYDGRMGGEKWVDFDSTITKGSIKGQ